MSVPAGLMPPPSGPPPMMGPPPVGLAPPGPAPQDPNTMGAPAPAPGGMPQPSALLAQLAMALQAEVAQKEQAAQTAVTTLAGALAGNPDPNSAAAVSAPGPITAAGSAPATDPNDPSSGGY